ncbi:3'-5' exonuclease [Citricoccus muralis]|uniref:DNA polymerase-3 subunit epsilon n=1 Tax=Citricoccus muralis TaxID=169134 RepID=A0A3D9LBH9_9MICC|nr:DNA polymerase-3 subunit epsilon [Citricoccus muralis]
MLPWHQQIRVGFDLETTGRDPEEALVVTASLVVVDPRGQLAAAYEWLVDPGVPIPEESSAVHGVTTEKARAEGLPADQAIVEIADTLRDFFDAGIPVIAFNASYDFTVMDRELGRRGLEPLQNRWIIDPYIIDKQVDRYRKGKRTLTDVSAFYGVELLDAHTSAADSLAAVGVADQLASRYPKLQIPLADLHSFQVRWKAEQSASFQEYLRRKDPAAVINGDWPVQGR